MELNSCKIIVGIVMETQTKHNFDMITNDYNESFNI